MLMKKTAFLLFLLPVVSFLSSCGHAVNDAGNAAGKTASEFVKGVGKGIDDAMEIKLKTPPALSEQGLTLGKSTVSSADEGTDNVLSVYVIYGKDFNGKLTAKVYDVKKNEIGRAAVSVVGKANDASYVTFEFPKQTNIDSDDEITIE